MSSPSIIVNINGQIGTPDIVKISVLDRGFLFGDSVYEVTRTHQGIPLFLQEHLDRLWHSAQGIGMQLTQDRDTIVTQIKKTLEILGQPDAYIRLIITRGEGDIGLDPGLARQTNMVIIAKLFRPNPEWWYRDGVHMIVPDIQRNAKRAIDPNIKSGNYLNNVLAYMQAKEAGAFDALMLNAQGHITEGTTNNIWFVENGVLKTPDLSVGLLKGITRDMILALARKSGIQVEEGAFALAQLKNASEAFLTSSTREIVPIVKVDDHIIGSGRPGEVTKKIHGEYRTFIEEHFQQHRHW